MHMCYKRFVCNTASHAKALSILSATLALVQMTSSVACI